MSAAPLAYPCITLTPGRRHRILNGHVWVFRSEIDRTEGSPASGDIVEVRDARRRCLGRGLYNTQSQIAVRLITTRSEPVDDAFWQRRFEQAIAFRERVAPQRPCLRLIHSEADRLPGLIVDRYADHIVIQTTTAGMDRLKPLWTRLILDRFKPRALIERNDVPVRKLEGLESISGVLHGTLAGPVPVTIGRATGLCDLLDPHKTGAYLDQQDNYLAAMNGIGPTDSVLDLFCHQAGFGIHLLLAGARTAMAVDTNAHSLDLARQSAALNGVESGLTLLCENAFDSLRRLESEKRRFTRIILDPPSFTRRRDTIDDALRGYKEIHVRALKLLAPGGHLLTFCCSHHISTEAFMGVLLEAAADVGVQPRRECILTASVDHPVLPAIPETEYLKGFTFSMMG